MTTEITADNVWDVVRDIMRGIQPHTSKAFASSVDKRGFWDGSPGEVSSGTETRWYYYAPENSSTECMVFKLTFGHLELAVDIFDDAKNGGKDRIITKVYWRYYIPAFAERCNLVPGDKINRSVPMSSLKNVASFTKALKNKFDALVESVEALYVKHENVFDSDKCPGHRVASTTGPIQSSGLVPYYIGAHRVVASVGRLRFNTQILVDRCKSFGLDDSVAQRLDALANEMNDILFGEARKHKHLAPLCSRTDYKWG